MENLDLILPTILQLVDRHKSVLSSMKKRGISVDPIWRGSSGREHFIKWSLVNGFSPELQLDRINPKLGYSPTNCQYITPLENQIKDYRTREYKGALFTLREIYDTFKGVTSFNTFKLRIWYGWSIDDALTIPSSRGSSWHRGSR